MTINDIFKESWLSISGNKIRSFLTVLGIIIGVMAVVIMVAVGETVEREISNQFSSLGSNTMMIRAGSAETAGIKSGRVQTLTISDAEIIGRLPSVTNVSPVQTGAATIVYGNKNWQTSITAGYPEILDVQNIEVEYGTNFDDTAVRNNSTHVVMGPETLQELGLPANPVGEIVRVNNTPFTIIGVTKARGDSAMGSQDDMLIMPITTLKKRIQGSKFPESVNMIILKTEENADNILLIEQMTALLRDRHKLLPDEKDDFEIMDMKQIMETMDTVTGYMTLLLIAIAGVSLLVGSIGIMNMMLVSVAERTREIGVRKAIGAREANIVIQFLSESVLISFLGSFAGLLLGIGLSQGIGRFVLGYDVPLTAWPAVLSFTVAIVVGLSSGVMPAIKAAKLNPIESLRYE